MAGEIGWLNPTDTIRPASPSKAALFDGIHIGWLPPMYFGWYQPWAQIAPRGGKVALRDGRAIPAAAPDVTMAPPFGWFAAWPMPARQARTNRSAASPAFGVATTTVGMSAPVNTGGTAYAVFDGIVAKRITGAASNTVQIRGRPTT